MEPPADRMSHAEIAQFQRREWKVQRAGWMVLAAFLGAGLAGLFGRGPLSHATAHDSGGWRLEYERFTRNHSPSRLTMLVPSRGQPDDTVSVWIDRRYADQLHIQEIRPTPLTVAVQSDRLIYRFLAGEGIGTLRIVFDFEPQAIGRLRARAGPLGSEGLSFSQLVYP